MEEEDEEEEEPCRERKQEGRSTHEPTDKNSNLPSKPFPQLIVFLKESLPPPLDQLLRLDQPERRQFGRALHHELPNVCNDVLLRTFRTE